MKSVNKNYIIFGLTILIVILLVIILLIVLNGKPQFSFNNQTDSNKTEEKNKNEELKNEEKVDSNTQDNISIEDTNANNQDTIIDNSTTTSDVNSNNTNSSNNSVSSEDELIAYFQNESNQMDTYNDQDNATFREKAKTTFINIIDFIFYDKEIKGYTFDELTNSAKLKVIKIALTIDNKIEKYFPNYKTIIKDKYSDIKGKLAVKYLEFTSSLCEQVGEDTCNQAKQDFNSMKESFGFTWSLIKELATNGKETIKNYYENEFKK